MKPIEKPESKIFTTQTTTNQKRKSDNPETMGVGSSLLKKNEFTLIIAGALVVTLIVFFVFFKSSGPKPQVMSGQVPANGESKSSIDLEKRIGAIESVLETLQAKGAASLNGASATPADLAPLQQKVERIETIVAVKLDSLIERMSAMEKQIRILDQKSLAAPATVTPSAPEPSSQKKPLVKKTAVAPAKKAAVTPANKAAMFHTVQKGETLWSISQKYKTTVANIRKLNNMPTNATIYPGINILVR